MHNNKFQVQLSQICCAHTEFFKGYPSRELSLVLTLWLIDYKVNYLKTKLCLKKNN